MSANRPSLCGGRRRTTTPPETSAPSFLSVIPAAWAIARANAAVTLGIADGISKAFSEPDFLSRKDKRRLVQAIGSGCRAVSLERDEFDLNRGGIPWFEKI
ncbi:hypothetical protein OH818_22155 [Jiella pelagia]|uniref:Uncharacterized protein n=1 Tax=Jiella pelagia TaxID=2986949 RepID=A0ABY7C6Q1_9HYPH|nr:hypothetical protein OH818_22155 [Jiella pelagia]